MNHTDPKTLPLTRRGIHRLAAAGVAAATLGTMAPALAAEPRVRFVTSQGEFVLELYPDKAPKTVENFLQYVRDGHYDGTIFHRVIKNFMIQGGGFDPDYKQLETRAPVPHEGRAAFEAGLKNVRGSVAMARTNDPNSATAQFFVNVVDNDFLDYTAPNMQGWGYTVFGRVVEGMDAVDRIRDLRTGRAGPFPSDVPRTMVVIESARITD